MPFNENYSLLRNCSTKSDLRIKQYKHIRNVITSQGYIAAGAAVGSCIFYEHGAANLRKVAADTVLIVTPFGAAVLAGKALTVTRKVGRLYRLGTMLYNGGMYPFKFINFVAQSPMMALDLIMIGEIYIPNLNATWWSIGNATDDGETLVKWVTDQK